MADPAELAFADDPDDEQKFQVWLDTLETQDELVGEYLQLAWATETNPPPNKATRTSMWKRLRTLRQLHAAEWFGVAPRDDEWRWGIARTLTLSAEPEVLERVLASRLGKLVPTLRLERAPLSAAALELLLRHRTLRALELDPWSAGVAFPIGALALRALVVNRGPISERSVLNPELESLTLGDVTLPPNAVDVFATSAPALGALTLKECPPVGQRLATRLLAAPTTHPSLRHLQLHLEDADAVIGSFVNNPLLARLSTLTLEGRFTERGLDLLVQHADRFRHLDKLVVDFSALFHDRVRAAIDALPCLARVSWRIDASAWDD